MQQSLLHQCCFDCYVGRDAGKLPGRPATVTAFGPASRRAQLEHTARFVPLVVALFEALLGCRLPYPAMHLVRIAIIFTSCSVALPVSKHMRNVLVRNQCVTKA